MLRAFLISGQQAAEDETPLVVDEQEVKRAVGATAMGNAMEWFDFGIYSYLAVVSARFSFPEAAINR